MHEEAVLGFPLPLRERDRVRGKGVATNLLIQTKSAVNQTAKDWHSRSVTLSPSATLRINSAKGLAVRFFAALRMTLLNGCVAKCTNVVHFDLVDSHSRKSLS